MCTFCTKLVNNFFSLRRCMRAQWEIRELAWKMLAECKKVAPVLFEKRQVLLAKAKVFVAKGAMSQRAVG